MLCTWLGRRIVPSLGRNLWRHSFGRRWRRSPSSLSWWGRNVCSSWFLSIYWLLFLGRGWRFLPSTWWKSRATHRLIGIFFLCLMLLNTWWGRWFSGGRWRGCPCLLFCLFIALSFGLSSFRGWRRRIIFLWRGRDNLCWRLMFDRLSNWFSNLRIAWSLLHWRWWRSFYWGC